MESTSLKIRAGNHLLFVTIEPWGEEIALHANHSIEIRFSAPILEPVEIEHGALLLPYRESAIKVYGFPGSTYEVYKDELKIASSDIPVPSTPSPKQTIAQEIMNSSPIPTTVWVITTEEKNSNFPRIFKTRQSAINVLRDDLGLIPVSPEEYKFETAWTFDGSLIYPVWLLEERQVEE